MKFTTFIKAYKLSLAEITTKVKDWGGVYFGTVDLPNETNENVVITFSSTPDMAPGSIGVTIAFDEKSVESLKGGISEPAIHKDYLVSVKQSNDAMRFLIALYYCYKQIKNEVNDIESVLLDSCTYSADSDVVTFNLIIDENCNQYLLPVYTNCILTMTGTKSKIKK